jgi:SPP1 gp7 family putative phage head morphogenesis protein
LKAYADALRPWARRAAAGMIAEVDSRERTAWRGLGNAISSQLHRDLQSAPVAGRMRELQELQVELITSLPTRAAERVHALTQEALLDGTRAKEIAEEIARSGDVTQSRALLIARTEVARTATALLQARCDSIGATHYVWRTAGDSDVRPGHRAMEGRVCEWANPPPVNEDGRIMYHHPGEIWNCRCWAEPIINDKYDTRPSPRR